jgi:pyridoxal phosphate enzyme (YggS family)
MKITENLNKIRNKIRSAENKFQREQSSVSLLAVSKTRSVDEIMTAYNAGQLHFGENYCQEAVEKIEAIGQNEITWHFIGPIQSNKTSLIAQYFDWVHTIDRIKIARRLNESRPKDTAALNICIQVNISGEESKSGIDLESANDFVSELSQFKRLKVRGLMALPAPSNNVDEQKAAFSKLHEKFNTLKQSQPEFDTLSIGTTQDMQAAIAEGATIVRIGTAIFGPRNVNKT